MRHLPEALTELSKELPLTLSQSEALEVMHVTPRTFRRIVARGEIKVIKASSGDSGRVLIPRSEILRWMSERMK